MASGAGVVPQDKWWSSDNVAVVTGGNKGIGYEIARRLAQQGVTTVVTARDGENLVFHQLDISDPESVKALANWLQSTYGGVDILVNNAGIAYKGSTFGADEAQDTLRTNLHGTMQVCEQLKPLLRENARIVNVCSTAGLHRIVPSATLRARFTGATRKEDVTALADEFVAAIRAGRHAQDGWPNSMYGISKLCEAEYTRLLAAELAPKRIMVNACCPGFCSTDMSSWRGIKTAEAGADTPVFLALKPPSEFATGLFFSELEPIKW